MYLHIGNDYIVNTKTIIGIFDIEKTSTTQITRNYLNSSKNIIYASEDMPKSFIVCLDFNNNEVIYISSISASTLQKRLRT